MPEPCRGYDEVLCLCALSASLGYLGNPRAEPVQSILRELPSRIDVLGNAPCILATNAKDAKQHQVGAIALLPHRQISACQ